MDVVVPETVRFPPTDTSPVNSAELVKKGFFILVVF